MSGTYARSTAIQTDWTKVLRRGEEAIRERLARPAVVRESEPAPAVEPDSQVVAGTMLAELANDLPTIDSQSDASNGALASPPLLLPGSLLTDPASVVGTVEAADAAATPPALPHLFAELSTGDRINQPLLYRDRTLLIALGIVTFLTLSTAVASIPFGDEPPEQTAEQEKRGQVEKSETITVELVEEPDAASKSKLSQMGENAPVAPPAEPTPDQQPAPPTPPEPEAKSQELEKKPQPQKAEKSAEKPLTIDDFDVTMNDYSKAVDQAQEQRRQQKAQQQTTQKSRIGGAAPQGQQSPYVKSVLAIVASHKPQVYISKGDVYVQFILNMNGQIAAIKVVETSGDKLLDQIALDSLKVLKFPVPPPNVNPNDLNYVIHYVMH